MLEKALGKVKIDPNWGLPNTTGKQLILVIGPWGRGEYHLEVYDTEGRLMFDKIVSEDIWMNARYDLPRMLSLIDFNKDGKEEIILAPYVFSLNGELLTNKYGPTKEPSYLLIADIDSDGEYEKVDSSYPFDVVRILGKDNILEAEIKLDEYSEKRGLAIVRSGPREITLLIGALTLHGYCASPLKCYYVQVSSQYGEVKGGGWYKAGETAAIKVSDTVDLHNGTRMVFAS